MKRELVKLRWRIVRRGFSLRRMRLCRSRRLLNNWIKNNNRMERNSLYCNILSFSIWRFNKRKRRGYKEVIIIMDKCRIKCNNNKISSNRSRGRFINFSRVSRGRFVDLRRRVCRVLSFFLRKVRLGSIRIMWNLNRISMICIRKNPFLQKDIDIYILKILFFIIMLIIMAIIIIMVVGTIFLLGIIVVIMVVIKRNLIYRFWICNPVCFRLFLSNLNEDFLL